MSCINKYYTHQYKYYIYVYITSCYAYLITLPFEETNLNGLLRHSWNKPPSFLLACAQHCSKRKSWSWLWKAALKVSRKKTRTPKQIYRKKPRGKRKAQRPLKSRNAWNTMRPSRLRLCSAGLPGYFSSLGVWSLKKWWVLQKSRANTLR